MARMIDLDEAIDKIRSEGVLGAGYDTSEREDDVCAMLESCNIVDAAPVVHGRWEDMGDFWKCSACNAVRLKEINTHYGKAVWVKTTYCSDCGAKMDLEEAGHAEPDHDR